MTHDLDHRAVQRSRGSRPMQASPRTPSTSRGRDMTTFNASALTPFADLPDYLATVETARRHHLDMLPTPYFDPAAGEHRATVEQIVEEVVTARHRLAAGLYGVYTGCNKPIAT